MMLGCYRLLAQVAAGTDGVTYRARAASEEKLVEVRVLGGARTNSARWAELSARLRRARLLRGAGFRTLRDVCLDHDPPYLVLDWVEGDRLAAKLAGRRSLPAAEVVALAAALAGALAEAHRLGIVHGRLGP